MIFGTITSLDDLKSQYRKLALKHHPDRGGDLEKMKQVNAEFEMLFKIWKIKEKYKTNETALQFTSEFYTQNGWQGANYDIRLSTKDITKIIRDALKLMYPLCKFSVLFESYSGGSTIYVALMEAPFNPFVSDEAITYHCINGKTKIQKHIQLNHYYIDRDDRITEQCKVMMNDVNDLITSYRYDDSDGMIDYFDTNFYYNIDIGKWNKDFKIVEKVQRIGNKPNCKDKKIVVSDVAKYTYEIKEDIDTRDNSKLFVVKIVEKLSKEDYIKANNYIQSLGGYYSKFKHGFIFKNNPKKILEKIRRDEY